MLRLEQVPEREICAFERVASHCSSIHVLANVTEECSLSCLEIFVLVVAILILVLLSDTVKIESSHSYLRVSSSITTLTKIGKLDHTSEIRSSLRFKVCTSAKIGDMLSLALCSSAPPPPLLLLLLLLLLPLLLMAKGAEGGGQTASDEAGLWRL